MKNNIKLSLVSLYIISAISCTTKQIVNEKNNPYEIKSELVVTDVLELTSKHVIYPSAYISTKGRGKVVVKEPITIIGKAQVFDTDVNIDFMPFTISEINPEWFGAKGYDNLDDTKAFEKVFVLAKNLQNSVNVLVSLGKFYISKTLEISNKPDLIKSINDKLT